MRVQIKGSTREDRVLLHVSLYHWSDVSEWLSVYTICIQTHTLPIIKESVVEGLSDNTFTRFNYVLSSS